MATDNRIQVLDGEDSDVFSVVNKIVKHGRQDEAFFICNVSKMVEKHHNWKTFLANIPIFYAVRCNDTRIVLETQAALGAGFSCVSREEIRRVMSLGVSPEKVIYAHPTKKISHLIYAAEMGIKLTVFDNEEELYKIKKHHPSAELILRLDTSAKSKCDSINKKYGARVEEVKHLLTVAASENLDVVGVAFYIESGDENMQEYSEAIGQVKEVFSIGFKLGFNFRILDIGVEYTGKGGNFLSKVSETINEALEHHFPNYKLKIMAEVGRYCVESAFKTVTHIHSKRITNGNKRMYYLDTGIYNGLMPAAFKNYFTCNPLKDHSKSRIHPSTLWGPTCDGVDIVSDAIIHLPDMEVGEWLIFDDTGANTLTLTFEFNGFTLPCIHSVIEKKHWLLLTRDVPKPISKSKFVVGDSIDNYLTGLRTSNVLKEL